MVDFRWVLHDGNGSEMRSTETWSTKEEAEGWMGEHWASLLDEVAETVSLMSDDKRVYKMGLRAE